MNPTPRLLIKLRAQAGAKALAATANLQPFSTGIVSVMWRGWSALAVSFAEKVLTYAPLLFLDGFEVSRNKGSG